MHYLRTCVLILHPGQVAWNFIQPVRWSIDEGRLVPNPFSIHTCPVLVIMSNKNYEYYDHDYDFDPEYEYIQDEDHYDDYVEDLESISYDPVITYSENNQEWVEEDEYPEEDYWDDEYWDDDTPVDYPEDGYGDQLDRGISPFVFILLAILFFVGFAMLIPLGQRTETLARPDTPPTVPAPTIESSIGGLPADTFVAPYDDYWVTQGVHGASYGHSAVDIAAGKGAVIRSPIAGRITEKTIDGVGNTMLVIENEYYTVTMLHGVYTVEIGDEVTWGDKVGEESNNGYTMDMQGRLCTGRDCGYHTHLNVYDKQRGQNVNPLILLSTAAEQQLVVGSRVQRAFELP